MSEEKLTSAVASQRNEFLSDEKYAGVSITKDLPKATLKGLLLTIDGNVTPTWPSGTPVARAGGVMNALFDNVEVRDQAGNLIDCKPRDFRYHAKRYTGKDSPALVQQDSKVLTSPSVGFFAFPDTSGKSVAVHETIHISFENELAEANFLESMLNYNGRDINTLKLDMNKIEKLQEEGGAVDVSYAHDLTIKINCLTTTDSGTGARWKKSQKERTYTSAPTKDIFDLRAVDKLMGLKIEITKGAKRTPISFDEAQKVKLQFFMKKGASATSTKDETLSSLIMNDLNKKKMDSITDGVGYMNFISGNLAASALPNTYDEFQLLVTLDSSLDFGSNPYHVRVVADEIE